MVFFYEDNGLSNMWVRERVRIWEVGNMDFLFCAIVGFVFLILW